MSFIDATRQNIRKAFTLKYEDGNRTSKDLPPTGLLSALNIRVKGTLKVTPGTGSATLKADQWNKPYGLLDYIHLTANSGTEIVNVSGQGLYVRNLFTDNHYLDVASTVLPEAQIGNPTYQFSTNTGDNAVEFTLRIPVAINDRDPVGLILLQSRETNITLALDWARVNNLFDITGNATVAFAGDAHVTMEYFSVPLDMKDYPDLTVAHTLLEDKIDVPGAGDVSYTIPRGHIYQRMFHMITLNGAPAGYDDITQLTLQYNQSEQPYKIDGHDMLARHRMMYKRDLPKGVYCWDFSYQGQAGLGGNRDLVNSKAITDFQSIVTVSNAATLGTNNNKIRTFREQLVVLQ